MKDLGRWNRWKRAATCAIPWLFLVTGARAEVGVVVLPGVPPSPLGSIIMAKSVDQPEPTPTVWSRLTSSPSLVLLNEGGDLNGDGPPSMLRTADGVHVVIWSKNSPAGHDVVLSRFENGVWSAPEVVAASSADELDPFGLVDPDGTVHLFYWEAGVVPRVMYRQATPDLSSWGVPVQVSEPGFAACRPAAVFHQGVLRVAYEVHDYGFGQTPRLVVIARQEAGGFVRDVVAVTQNPGPIWPQVHSRAGKLWVDWIDAEGQAVWTRSEPSGGWSPVQAQPYVNVIERDFFVRGTIQHRVME